MLNNKLFQKIFFKMSSCSKKFMTQFSSNINYRIMWVEQLLYCVVLGVWFHLWLASLFLFVVLSWLLNKPKGIIYSVYTLSFSWGLMALLGAYFIGGLGWGLGWGICTLMCALGIHFRDLKQPFYEINTPEDLKEVPSWLFGRQNLN